MVKKLKWVLGDEVGAVHSVAPTEYSPFEYTVSKIDKSYPWGLEVFCQIFSTPRGEDYPMLLEFKTKTEAMVWANNHFKEFVKSCLEEEV